MKHTNTSKVLSLAVGTLALGSVVANAVPTFDTGSYVDNQSNLYVKWTFNKTDVPMTSGNVNWALDINTYNFVLGTAPGTASSYWAGSQLKMGQGVDYYPATGYFSDFDIHIKLNGVHSFTSPAFPSVGTSYPFPTQDFRQNSDDLNFVANWQDPVHGSGSDLYRATVTYNKNTGNGVVVMEGFHNVPDAGASIGLLGLALAGLGIAARRKS